MSDTAKKIDDPHCLGLMNITDEEFEHIRSYVHRHFGIHLSDQKKSMVVGRIQGAVRSHGFTSFREYYECLINDTTGHVATELVNRITTNHTFFFREAAHFEFLSQEALPWCTEKARKEGSNDLRFWSAGCATGEEAYTILIALMEFLKTSYSDWNAGLLATDISQRALDFAQQGEYPSERTAHVPPDLKTKYFDFVNNGDDLKNRHRVKEFMRKEVAFRRFNLMNDRFPFNKPFHFIFCRNVMIYFDQNTRIALTQKFFDCLLPGGYLFVGHSESLLGGQQDQALFEYVMPAVYRRRR